MDFTPDPEQQAVADVVTAVLDRDNSWDALVAGGVTALGVPERLGGDGVGLPEIATALTEIGRHGDDQPGAGHARLGRPCCSTWRPKNSRTATSPASPRVRSLTAALNEPGAALPDRPATALRRRQAQRHQDRGSAMRSKRNGWSSPPTAPSWWCRRRPTV